jgi:hypothetical protein
MSCPADQIFFGGAAGGGKSDCGFGFNSRGVSDYGKNWRAIFFRKTYPQLAELVRRGKELYQPLGVKYNDTKHIFRFPNGAELQLASLDRDGDVERYQGHQYTFIFFDELGNWASDYCWTYMSSRCRSAAGVPCQMLGAGNPGGVGQGWIKNKFIDGFKADVMYKIPVVKKDDGQWEYISQCFIPSKLEDNPSLLDRNPQYKTYLLSLPEMMRRALYEGDWDIYSGQVFEEWRRDRHVIKPFALPPDGWYKFYSLDWGYAKPYSISKIAVNYDGKVIKYGEIYGCKKEEVNKGVKESSMEAAAKAWEHALIEGVTHMVADPACWNRNDSFPAPADSFEKAGFKMIKGNHDRLAGVNTFHDFLRQNDENGQPMFQVFTTCYHTIRTLPALLPDPHNPEDVDSKMEDHIYDSDRYALMSDFVSRPQFTLDRRGGRSADTQRKRGVYSPLEDW